MNVSHSDKVNRPDCSSVPKSRQNGVRCSEDAEEEEEEAEPEVVEKGAEVDPFEEVDVEADVVEDSVLAGWLEVRSLI